MRTVFCALALSLLASSALADDVWTVNPRVFSCTPVNLARSGALRLNLAKMHGRELGVQRLSDNAWFFLVVASPPLGATQLMTTKAFTTARSVLIRADYQAPVWDTQKMESVFSKPGEYELYVSDNLESEDGGYKCKVSVRQ